MIEDVCRAQFLLVVMNECETAGWFARTKARSPAYRERVESGAAYMIDRIRDALVLPGEVLEQFSTCRGLAAKLGCSKSSAWTLMQRFKTLQIFQHNKILRRWQVNRPSHTQGSNPYWWMPTVWRIGERFTKYFRGSNQSGTKLADSSLGSHYRTRVSPKASDSSSGVFSPDSQQDQGLKNGTPSRPVLIKPIDLEHLIAAVDRLDSKLIIEGHRAPTMTEAQDAVRSIRVAIEAIEHLECVDRFTRLEVARRKLAQAHAMIELAELAEMMRPVHVPEITPKGAGHR